jgi:hypothetical protein
MHLKICDSRWLLLLAVAGLLLPQSVPASGVAISDASLHDGGTLYGQLVDGEGIPQQAVQVKLRHGQEVVAVAKTDALGRFAIGDLRSGVYEVETVHGSQVYRLWAPRTAPPAAQQRILVVTGNEIVRGQTYKEQYGPAIRGAVAGGLITGLTYWAFDYNPTGS